MKNRWSILLAAGASTAALGLAPPVQALTDSERLEKLERHIERLEKRLGDSEAENAKLRKEQQGGHGKATAVGYKSDYQPESVAKPASEQEVKTLNTRLRKMERTLEVEKEVSDNTRKSAAKIEAGPSGFKVGTADGDWQLRLRGFLQGDTNTYLDDTVPAGEGIGWNSTTKQPNPVQPGVGLGVDKFIMRRVRLQFAGTLGKYTDFLIAPDFGQGQARLFDAWADFHYYQPLSFAFGKMKGPQDLERLQNATNLLFNERGYATQLAANRQIGAMIHGELEGPGYDTEYTSNISHTLELFQYQMGVFNASFDNQAVQNSDTANFDNKEYAARFFSHPFRHVDFEPIQRLGVGFAGNYTDWAPQGGIASLTSQGQNNILTYATGTSINPGTSIATAVTQASAGNPITTTTTTTSTSGTTFSQALVNGSQYHLAPQGYWYYGPMGLFADWTASTQGLAVQQTDTATTAVKTDTRIPSGPNSATTVSRTTTSVASSGPKLAKQTTQTNTAWQVAASYVLTGEDNTYWAIKPREKFNPMEGNWGAWQLAFRWSELNIDPNTFTNYGTASQQLYLFADPRSSVQHASTWGLGVNWFLNSNVKIQGNYEQTQFTGGAVTANNTITNRPDEKVFFTRVQFWY